MFSRTPFPFKKIWEQDKTKSSFKMHGGKFSCEMTYYTVSGQILHFLFAGEKFINSSSYAHRINTNTCILGGEEHGSNQPRDRQQPQQ